MNTVRTRIAPSPTGENLHIGNAYTALINYVFAKKHGGQFIIRIEDTDRTRFVEGSEKRILESLKWLGITHDEGPDLGGPYMPYRQSDRLPIYQKYARELVNSGHAYYCFCTPERLERMRATQMAEHKPPMYDGSCKTLDPKKAQERVDKGEKYVIRLRVPDTGETVFSDIIRGEIRFENRLIDDQVLIKSDGYPTYHMGVVIDDHLMNITHIIRGEEWISSVPKHILLYMFFGWELPVFAHVPLLRNPDKSKLSKRKNPVWASWYREEGFLPEAVVNYLATLAWAHPEGKEIFSLSEMIAVFDPKVIQTTAPVFDIEKLRWMNGEYFRKTQSSKLRAQICTYFNGKFNETIIDKTLPLVIERMKTFKEYESLAGFFYEKPTQYERVLNKAYVGLLREVLSDISDWTHDDMEKAIRGAAEEKGIKPRDIFMELRIAVTGKTVGPPLLESLEILEKEETLARLEVI